MRNFQAATIFTLLATATCLTVNRTPEIKARSSWDFQGCYTDSVPARTLPNLVQVPGGTNAMTNELCQSTCQSNGYSIAGTEYAGECWCGNSFANGGGPAADGTTGCNMACKGNANERCGGPNRLDVYVYSSVSVPGKRGLTYDTNNPGKNASWANLFEGYSKVTWGYDYGYPSHNLSSKFEFVPQLFTLPSGDDPSWTATVQTPGTKYIMGYNEPDLTYSDSANLLPAPAAAGYQKYIEPFKDTVKIGTPNVLWNNYNSYTSGGNYNSRIWTQYFLGNCTGCHFDYAAIHWYQDCEPEWFTSNVTDVHQAMNLPVWITEFQCYGTDAEQVSFLQDVLPWLDSQEYVQRYAYFGVYEGYLLDSTGTGLSDIGVTYVTT